MIGDFYFSNDSGEATVPQCVLGQRKRHRLIFALEVKQLRSGQSGLFEPGGVKIEPRQRPGDIGAGRGGKPRGEASSKERGGGIITKRRRGSRHLVEPCTVNAARAQAMVQFPNAER
jgi:hypothetical protein